MNAKTLRCEELSSSGRGVRTFHVAIAFAVTCGMVCFASSVAAQEKPDKESGGKGSKGAGIYFNAEASAKDVGLPVYPGARPYKEKNNDNDSVKMGLWGSSFAFKLAVVKLESNDTPQKVAAFYKKALARYGTVLDCSADSSKASEKGEGKESNKLTCEGDKPDSGGVEFKAGTKEKQHAVGIQPNGSGSVFQLVYVEAPESDKKK